MPNLFKESFVEKLKSTFGSLNKLPKSQSLFDLSNNSRIYIRYSKRHGDLKTFYGLRKSDLIQLQGLNSHVVFLWDYQKEPVIIPYSEIEDIFDSIKPAQDGQYKAQIINQQNQHELYIAGAGRFNIERFFGWQHFENSLGKTNKTPEFSHSQIQTIIGSIGILKGYDIWIPSNDRNKIDSNYSDNLNSIKTLPKRYNDINHIIREIDVIWLKKGSSNLHSLFEVEHSTPIYSGLLRFNDLFLDKPELNSKFNIVSNNKRRSLFTKQIRRPTFRSSGLSDLCTFMEYSDVYGWFKRIKK